MYIPLMCTHAHTHAGTYLRTHVCTHAYTIQFESSGCGKTWAETRGESFAFTCKGCAEVTALVKEVEGLRQMVEDMMEKVAGLRFEDKGAETARRVTKTGGN